MDARGIAEPLIYAKPNSAGILEYRNMFPAKINPLNRTLQRGERDTSFLILQVAACSGEKTENSCSCSRQLVLAKGTPSFRVPGGFRSDIRAALRP